MRNGHIIRRRGPLGVVCAMAGLTPIVAGVSAPARAEASCILAVDYHGASFIGAYGLADAGVQGPVGMASLPPCIDTVPPPVVTPASRVLTAYRVRDVAPRFAVAVRLSGTTPTVVVADGTPCPAVAAQRLACLRRLTRTLRTGPALVAPLSAPQGAVVAVTVRVADPSRRRRVTVGLDTLLQRRVGSTWRTAYHLLGGLRTARPPDPVPAGAPGPAVPAIGLLGGTTLHVRVPETPAGTYRLATRATVGRGTRWLTALMAVRDVPGPCSYCVSP